jgi:RNA polymerase sigma-70 factor, ECF subfamily
MRELPTTSLHATLDPDRWVDQHGDELYRYAMLRLGDPEAAADLVQETFLEAFRTREGFAGRSSERTWLTAILRHRIVDHFRRERRGQSKPLGAAKGTDSAACKLFDSRGAWKRAPGVWEGRPDLLLERHEFREVVESCLARLPSSLAVTFWLREIDGLSGEEVCFEIGITPANLWARLHRARILLRDCLDRHWFRDLDRPNAFAPPAIPDRPPLTSPGTDL